MIAPFFAPGIAFNSIKSGIAVDYPMFVPKKDRPFAGFCTSFNKESTNTCLIGKGEDWAHVLTGSASTLGAAGGISIGAWISPENKGTNGTSGGGTIVSLGRGLDLYLNDSDGMLTLLMRGEATNNPGSFTTAKWEAPHANSAIFNSGSGTDEGAVRHSGWQFVGVL